MKAEVFDMALAKCRRPVSSLRCNAALRRVHLQRGSKCDARKSLAVRVREKKNMNAMPRRWHESRDNASPCWLLSGNG